MCLNSFLKASKGNNRIYKSSAFHNVGAAYTKDLSKNDDILMIVFRKKLNSYVFVNVA